MRFFKTVRGTLHPVSAISSIRPGTWRQGSGASREAGSVTLVDHGDVTVEDDEIQRVTRGSEQIIPAQPGFTLLSYWEDDATPDEPYIQEQPILGWSYDLETGPKPIVLEPDEGRAAARTAILLPSGAVIRPHDCEFEDRAAWLKSVDKDVAEERAARATIAQGQSPQT